MSEFSRSSLFNVTADDTILTTQNVSVTLFKFPDMSGTDHTR